MNHTAAESDGQHLAYLSLGANIGDRAGTLARALELIGAMPGVELLSASPFYATDPVGYRDQPEFLNCAAVVRCRKGAQELLEALRGIERSLGRVVRPKWHEREIDIDIILFDREIISSETLTIPHPEMQRRAFVLVPLAQIAPDAFHPLLGRTVRELLDAISPNAGIRDADHAND